MVAQDVWHGLVIWYLFLAGTGAGAYLIAIGNKLFSSENALVKTGYLWGPILVSVGTVLLLLDLGRPFVAFLAVLRPLSSMISVGTIILTFFILVGLLQIYLAFFKKQESPRGLDIAGFVLAIGTATYTGLLLGVVKAIPFWNSPVILPGLFLVSALSSGAGFIFLVSVITKAFNDDDKATNLYAVMKFDVLLIIVEGVLLTILLLLSAKGHPAAAASVDILTKGSFAFPFWGLVVIMGLLVPFILEALVRSHKQSMIALCSLALLIGGVTLRYSVVIAGVWIPMK